LSGKNFIFTITDQSAQRNIPLWSARYRSRPAANTCHFMPGVSFRKAQQLRANREEKIQWNVPLQPVADAG